MDKNLGFEFWIKLDGSDSLATSKQKKWLFVSHPFRVLIINA